MATDDEPRARPEALAAAEAAHLAARSTVPATTSPPARTAPPAERRTRAPLALAAGFAASWAALVSWSPVAVIFLGLRVAEDGSFAVGEALRAATAGWLLGHGVAVQTPVGPVGMVPLALTALAAWRLVRAGVHVTRTNRVRGPGAWRQAVVTAAAVGIAYGLLGLLVGWLVDSPGWAVAPWRAGLTMAGFGLLPAGCGALAATGVLAGWVSRVPSGWRAGGLAGVVAAVVLVAAGSATAGVAIAIGGGAAADTLAAYRTGLAGQAGLTLLCLAYAPNLAVWTVAYLVGPGFAVGTATTVRGGEVAIGALPPLPVFAGLPSGPLPTVSAVLLTLPVVAGAVAGWLIAKELPGWSRVTGGALLSGVTAGVLLGLAAAASGGSLGSGDLATLGPDPVLTGLFSAVAIAIGALLAGALTAGFLRRSQS